MADKVGYRLPPQNIFLIIAIVAMTIALGLIAGGIAYAVVTANKTRDYVKTDAIVTDIVEVRVTDHNHGGKKTLYSEIVEYTVDGQTYSKQNTSASSLPKSKGSKITILYNADNPDDCVFKETTIANPVILIVLGVAFGIAGIALLRYYIKDRKLYIEWKSITD